MAGNIGDSFTQVVPPVSTPGPTYASTINDILTEVMGRLSVKVPLASLNLNSTFSLGGNPLTNAGYVTLTNAVSNPSGVPSPVNRVTAFGGDLYYVSPTGAVQITTGAALNSASIGGITGTYGGASPAQFRHDAVNTRYDAYENFGTNTWAYVRALGFDIAAGSTSAIFARLLFGGASNKTYTLPVAAASTADRPLFMDSTGQITVGHGTKEIQYSPFAYSVATGAASDAGVSADGKAVETKTTNQPTLYFPLTGLIVGQQLTSLVVRNSKANTSSTSYAIVRVDLTRTSTTVWSTSSTTLGSQTTTVTGAAHTVLTGNNYFFKWSPTAAASDDVSVISLNLNQPS